MVARELRQLLAGRIITRARLLRPGLAPLNAPQVFARSLKGVSVLDIERRGKHLLAHVSGGTTLITHLRMTGRFLDVGASDRPPAHTHAIFWLDTGRKLLFIDQRHFARMQLVSSSELHLVEQLRRLAPEPFHADFDAGYLHGVIRQSSRAIKLVLLDQTRVVGLGNIYAAEALFRAGISPRLPGARLSFPRARLLHREIIGVLTDAIESGSRPYSENDESWGVYDREGEPCKVCSVPIRRIVQGGRSTYYCSRCQRR